MIREQNQDLVKVLFFHASIEIRKVYKFQAGAFLFCALFVILHASNRFERHSMFFTFLWISFELLVLIIVSRMNRMELLGSKIVSFAAKKNVLLIMEGYACLRYIKFLALLCNFLGVVGAIKSMRVTWEMDWSIIACLLCLFVSYYLLKACNQLLAQLKKSIDIYSNFQMIIDGEIDNDIEMMGSQ